MSTSITQRHFSAIENILVDDRLQIIFVFASSEWDSATPLAISQVSRHWRDVALSTPEMWTQVSINEDSIDYSVPRPPVHRRSRTPSIYFPAVGILQNSSQYPLDIRINIPAYGTGRSRFGSFYVDLLASLFYPHRARISQRVFRGNIIIPSRAYSKELVSLYFAPSSFNVPTRKTSHPPWNSPLSHLSRVTVPFLSSSLPGFITTSLLGTVCTWTKFSGRNLTSITIDGIPCTARPTIEQLRAIQEHAQGVEDRRSTSMRSVR